MPYQTFDFVKKDFIGYDEASALRYDVVHKRKNLDDLDFRQKNMVVELYRSALRHTNLQIQQKISSIKANKITAMDYQLNSKLTSLNARLKNIDVEYQANFEVSDISLYSDDLFEDSPLAPLMKILILIVILILIILFLIL